MKLRAIAGGAFLMLVVAAVAAVWLYMEKTAVTVTGQVVAKRERTTGGRYRGPTRYLDVSFEMPGATAEEKYIYGSPRVSSVEVDEATYDARRIGDAQKIQYLPINPGMARLEERLVPPRFWQFALAAALLGCTLAFRRTRGGVLTTALFAAALVVARPGAPPLQFILMSASVLLCVALALNLFHKRSVAADGMRKTIAPLVVLASWGAIMLVVAGIPALRSAGAAQRLETTGTVVDVRTLISPRPGNRKTPFTLQDFDRVQLEFVPPNSAEPSVGVDFIDRGSAGTVSEGSRMLLTFDPRSPRHVRLVTASRRHYRLNALLPVGAATAMVWLTSRRARKARANVASSWKGSSSSSPPSLRR